MHGAALCGAQGAQTFAPDSKTLLLECKANLNLGQIFSWLPNQTSWWNESFFQLIWVASQMTLGPHVELCNSFHRATFLPDCKM